VLHYSLTGGASYPLSKPLWDYLSQTKDSYKILFCQDENYNCGQRFRLINQYNLDWIYSVLDPQYYQEVYYSRCPSVKRVFHTLTGYVSENMLAKAKQYAKPWDMRTIDVGYRARTLPPYLGRGAMEKQEIGLKFLEKAKGLGLRLDIKVSEESRLYGDAYYKWLGNCKAVLGVEAGGSIFDLGDEVWNEYWEKPRSYEQMPPELMARWEDRIFYRTISPRHFEAAAFKCAQILYEGNYNGILEPWNHYVPLQKDWSNFGKIASLLRTNRLQTWALDLAPYIGDEYSYRQFIKQFDQNLFDAGFSPSIEPRLINEINQRLKQYSRQGKIQRILETTIFTPYYKPWPGKRMLISHLYHPAKKVYCAIKGYNRGEVK
jgi:hypothetical protein